MEKVKGVIDKLMEFLCVSIMSLMTILVTWQVFTRYVLNKPSAVSEVLARYLFVWLVIAAAAYVFGQREHMSITFFRDKLPVRPRMLLEIVGEVIILVFAGCVLLAGGLSMTTAQMIQMDATIKIPMGMIYSILPISGAITVFYCTYNIGNLIKDLRSPERVNKEIAQ